MHKWEFNHFHYVPDITGARGGAVVEALRYKPEGHGFHSRCCHWIFLLTILPVALWP
jgi:hypothetical protein